MIVIYTQRLKHPPAMQETWVRTLGGENPLEKEMATLENRAWRIVPGESMEGGAW